MLIATVTGWTAILTEHTSFSLFWQALWKQSQVFQLDPVKGDAAPVIPDTKQQKTLSQAILHGITDMLMGSDLNCNLRSYQLEITEVS